MSKKVSVIIPTRNEEQFIVETLESVLGQDYPSSLLEVIIADGDSDDNTPKLIQGVIEKFPNVILINNPERVVPFALNYAINKATGDFIIRMDSHSIYPENYISTLVKESENLKADNVGARVVTHPANNGLVATGIAAAISHPLGVGNSSFRLKGKESQEVDTVPFGCFPSTLFKKIGLFDTDLIRNQDDEFNGRIIKNGGKIFLVPNLEIEYYARGTISKLMKMFYQYGLFKPLVNSKLGSAATLRQFAPPA
ncbi:MAG: glycosyltransferase involved in cell wall biosynthesis, partial [Dokdonia sp.]